MTAYNCPMCVLRFGTKNERDWHLRNEHEHVHVHRPADEPPTWWHRDPPGEDDEDQPGVRPGRADPAT